MPLDRRPYAYDVSIILYGDWEELMGGLNHSGLQYMYLTRRPLNFLVDFLPLLVFPVKYAANRTAVKTSLPSSKMCREKDCLSHVLSKIAQNSLRKWVV